MQQDGILLLGGGGHCLSVFSTLKRLGDYQRIGIVTKELRSRIDAPVLGDDDDLPRLFQEGYRYAFLCIGGTDSAHLRETLYQRVKAIGFLVPSLIDPSSIIGNNVSFAEGVFIGKGVVLNDDCRIGCGTIVNTGAILEHEGSIGSFSHIAPGCVLCGAVTVGDRSLIGANSTVIQCLKIGHDTMIGAGSVVTRDIPDHSIAYGNPCTVRKQK